MTKSSEQGVLEADVAAQEVVENGLALRRAWKRTTGELAGLGLGFGAACGRAAAAVVAWAALSARIWSRDGVEAFRRAVTLVGIAGFDEAAARLR